MQNIVSKTLPLSQLLYNLNPIFYTSKYFITYNKLLLQILFLYIQKFRF